MGPGRKSRRQVFSQRGSFGFEGTILALIVLVPGHCLLFTFIHFKSRAFCKIEPRREKTGLRGFRPGPTQTGLYSHRRWLEAGNFVFRNKRDCTTPVAKTKALVSCAVTAKLICVFVFAYAKRRFSHGAALMVIGSGIFFEV